MDREEEADEIIRRLATHPEPPISDFQRIVLPLIRKIYPELMAQEIVAVQPMFTYKDKE
jgi:hypothetical protein